jgi:cytochrome P450
MTHIRVTGPKRGLCSIMDRVRRTATMPRRSTSRRLEEFSMDFNEPAGADIDIDRLKIKNIDLWSAATKFDPGALWMEWAVTPPFYVEVAGAPQAVITRYEDAKIAFEDVERFSNVKRPWPGTEKYYYWQGLPVVTDNDPPNHTRLRRLLAPAFSPRKLASVETGIKAYVAVLLDQIAQAGSFDAVADLGRTVSAHTLLGLILDLPEADWPVFTNISDGLGMFANLPPGAKAPEAFTTMWSKAQDYCAALIEERQRAPKDDLVSHIIASHDSEGKITTAELYATFIILYAGGFSSIVTYIAWTLWRVCSDPAQLALVQNDPALLGGALAESLRTDPVGWTALRYATRDFEFAGLQIKENMPVILVEGASNYDPRVYKDPTRFDLRRPQPREVLSFGSGVHRCIGAPLARLTARLAVGAVIARFPKLRLSDPAFRPLATGGPKERGASAVPLLVG